MANTTHNPKQRSNFPATAGKREARLSTTNFSCAETDSDFTVETNDGVNFVRNSGANTITLPNAAENKGRTLTLLQADLNTMTVTNSDSANIDGSAPDFTSLDAADDWCELFCTGSEWLVTKQNIA